MTAALKCACQSLAAAGWKVTCAACGSKMSATPSADATGKVGAPQPVAFPVAPNRAGGGVMHDATWRCLAGDGWVGDGRSDALDHERLAHEGAAVCAPDDPEITAYRAGTLDAYLAANTERLAGIEVRNA